MSLWLVPPAFAANPFLDAKEDRPVSANFRGTEWNDENIGGKIPLTARVATTRIATMSWGAIFKIEFVDLKLRVPEKREIRPDYFIVTNDRIVLLNEGNNEQAASGRRLANDDLSKRRSLRLRFSSPVRTFQENRLEQRRRPDRIRQRRRCDERWVSAQAGRVKKVRAIATQQLAPVVLP